jgi:vacuolar iron transporter family protein
MARPQSRSVARFLSDFTLGFSDGLTVPFALCAGLSSLGRTQTVIYAGLAELCAGSISMGIGGYLSALDDTSLARQDTAAASVTRDESGEMGERLGMLDDESDAASEDGVEKINQCSEDILRCHLQPLNLAPDTMSEVLRAIAKSQHGLDRTAAGMRSRDMADANSQEPSATSPWFSGMSISLGYIIGGLIPLLPYCIASTIAVALAWSVGLCLISLFAFGFGKSCLLSSSRISLAQSFWQGLRMMVLGALAAAVAVACIRLVEGGKTD